jgi:hypothetical protein
MIRGLESLAHWYSRQEPSEATAVKAAELLRLLVTRYDQFWEAYWAVATRGDLAYEAAHNAIDRGIEFRSAEEIQWWMQNHIPPDSE